MLKKLAQARNVQIITSDNNRQRNAESITYYLEGDIVYVRLVIGKEYNGLLLLGCFLGNGAQAKYLFARNMDAYNQ
jgi:hypothetical protein